MSDPVSTPVADPTVAERHRKQLAVMRGYLEGRRYWKAMEALQIVRDLSDGVRKDGVTPKFHHQLSVTRLLTTLEPFFIYPEETIAAGLLHDEMEDNGDKCTRESLEAQFGKRIADAVWTLSKKSNGMVKSSESYYKALGKCPIASLVKLADRNHNIQTMEGVFSKEKQLAYIGEVETYFYPMIKEARHAFPSQYGAYENLKITLRCQCRLIRYFQTHGA